MSEPYETPNAKDPFTADATAKAEAAKQKTTEQVDKLLENLRGPFYALFGAGDIAAEAVNDVVGRVRDRAESARGEARNRFEPLTDQAPQTLDELKDKLQPEEIKRFADQVGVIASDVYRDLVERGTDAYTKYRQKSDTRTTGTTDTTSTAGELPAAE